MRRDGSDPVSDPRRVEQAGVVSESELAQDVVRPDGVARDRAPRCSVSNGPQAADALDYLHATDDVAPELLGRLVVHADVLVTVTADLVPPRHDLRKRPWVTLGCDSRDEEGRADAEVVEKVEQCRDVPLECVASGAPVRSPDLL